MIAFTEPSGSPYNLHDILGAVLIDLNHQTGAIETTSPTLADSTTELLTLATWDRSNATSTASYLTSFTANNVEATFTYDGPSMNKNVVLSTLLGAITDPHSSIRP